MSEKISCSEATNEAILVKKAGVPEVRGKVSLVLPQKQMLIPAFDAQNYASLLGIGSAVTGKYTFNINYNNTVKTVQIKVEHELPKARVTFTANGVRIEITKDQPYVYKYVAVVKGYVSNDVNGLTPTGEPAFVDVHEIGTASLIAYDKLFKSYGFVSYRNFALIEIEVHAIPKVFPEDSANDALIASLKAYYMKETLLRFKPNQYKLAWLLRTVTDNNVRRNLQNLFNTLNNLLNVLENLVLNVPPTLTITTAKLYTNKLPNVTFGANGILVFSAEAPPVLYKKSDILQMLSDLIDSVKKSIALDYYTGSNFNEALNQASSEHIVVELESAKSKFEELTFDVTAIPENVKSVFDDLGSIISFLSGEDEEITEETNLLGVSLLNRYEVRAESFYEDGSKVKIIGTPSATNFILPDAYADLLRNDVGVKKHKISVRAPLLLYSGFSVTRFLKVEKQGNVTYDPDYGHMEDVIVTVNVDEARKVVPNVTGSDADILSRVVGVNGSLVGVAVSTTLRGNHVHIFIPFGANVFLPSEIVRQLQRKSIPVYPVYTEVESEVVYPNPDAVIDVTNEKVRFTVLDWSFVKKRGFQLSLYLTVLYKRGDTAKVTVIEALSEELSRQTIEQLLQGDQKTVKFSVNLLHTEMDVTLKGEGGWVVLDLNDFLDKVKAELSDVFSSLFGEDVEVIPLMVVGNLKPTFVAVPYLEKKKYTDVTLLSDFPYILSYFADKNVKQVKLNVHKPTWLNSAKLCLSVVKLEGGKVTVSKDEYCVNITLPENTTLSTLQIEVETDSDKDEVLVSGNKITFRTTTRDQDYAGVAVRIVDGITNFPIVYRNTLDELTSEYLRLIRELDVSVGREGLVIKFRDGSDKKVVRISGTEVEVSAITVASVLQEVAFMFKGLEALGIYRDQNGNYVTDSNLVVTSIEYAKRLVTPFLILSALYNQLAFAQLGDIVSKTTGVTPILVATPATLSSEIPSILLVAEPAEVVDINGSVYDQYVTVRLDKSVKLFVTVRNIQFSEGIARATSDVFVSPHKGDEHTIPVRDVAFLSALKDLDYTVPKISIEILGFKIDIGEQSLYDAVRTVFEKAYENEKFGTVYKNALEIEDVRNAVKQLFELANSNSGGQLKTNYPFLWEIVQNGILKLPVRGFTVDFAHAIVSPDVIASDRKVGEFTVYVSEDIAQKGVPVAVSPADAENDYFGYRNGSCTPGSLCEKIVKWARGEGSVQITESDTTIVYLYNVRELTIMRGETTVTVKGYKSVRFVDLVPFVATIVPTENVADMLKEELYSGRLFGSVKVAGHAPYVTVVMNYDAPVKGSAENRTLIYRVRRDSPLIPKLVERVYKLAVQYDQSMVYLVSSSGIQGFVRVESLTIEQGKDIPSASTQILEYDVRPEVKLLITHPLDASTKKPLLVLDIQPGSKRVDIDPQTFYKVRKLEFYENANKVREIDVVKESKVEISDYDFFSHPVLEMYYSLFPAENERRVGEVILDSSDKPVYGFIDLAPSAVSRNSGAFDVKTGEEEGTPYILLYTTDSLKDIWNVVVKAYRKQPYLSAIFFLYFPVVSATIDYEKYRVKISVSGIPTTLLRGVLVSAQFGAFEKAFELKTENGTATMTFSRCRCLPERFTVIPKVGDAYVTASATTFALASPTVTVTYDTESKTVKASVADFGYSRKVKLAVHFFGEKKWVKEYCLDETRREVEIEAGTEPLAVGYTLHDAYGIQKGGELLYVRDAGLYKTQTGKYVLVMNPVSELAVFVTDENAFNGFVQFLQKNKWFGTFALRYRARGIAYELLSEAVNAGFPLVGTREAPGILDYNPAEGYLSFAEKVKNGTTTLADFVASIVGSTRQEDGLEELFTLALNLKNSGYTADDIRVLANTLLPVAYKVADTTLFTTFRSLNAKLATGEVTSGEMNSIGVSRVETGYAVYFDKGDVVYLVTPSGVKKIDTSKAEEVTIGSGKDEIVTTCFVEPQPPDEAQPVELYEAFEDVISKYGVYIGAAALAMAVALAFAGKKKEE